MCTGFHVIYYTIFNNLFFYFLFKAMFRLEAIQAQIIFFYNKNKTVNS